jgi:putative transposase
MTLNQSALLELTEAMRTADDSKLMRTLLHTILQALVDAEATEHIGAGMHEQNDTRTTQRIAETRSCMPDPRPILSG